MEHLGDRRIASKSAKAIFPTQKTRRGEKFQSRERRKRRSYPSCARGDLGKWGEGKRNKGEQAKKWLRMKGGKPSREIFLGGLWKWGMGKKRSWGREQTAGG